VIRLEAEVRAFHDAISSAVRFTTGVARGLDAVWLLPTEAGDRVKVVGSDNRRIFARDLRASQIDHALQPVGIHRMDVMSMVVWLLNVEGSHVWFSSTTERWTLQALTGRMEGIPTLAEKIRLYEVMVDPGPQHMSIVLDPTLLDPEIGEWMETPARMWVGGKEDPLILGDGKSRFWLMPMRDEGRP
jgi:hypothetical protein